MQPAIFQGWVKSIRTHKNHIFFHIIDGSSPQPLQIVASPELIARLVIGACVSVYSVCVCDGGKGMI